MEISITPEQLQDWNGTVLISGILQETLEEQMNCLERLAGGSLQKRLVANGFTAKSGDVETFQLLTGKIEKLILVGLGEANTLAIEDLRTAASIGAKESIGHSGTLGILLPWEAFNEKEVANAVGEAARLSLFKDLRFRSSPEQRTLPSKVELIGLTKLKGETLEHLNPICSGVELARELVGAPANTLTPAALANEAARIANENDLELKLLERKDCEKRGMGAYLAVCRGSDLDPKFIHLIYRPKGKTKKRIALVGKGLTFDSGGYNLKVGASQIELMKFDMGGSAAVLGAAKAISAIRPIDIEVHFIVAACENMINGSAIHPGDIVTASNGTTIEINNTDAEGRLTLADALVYACDQKPDAIVDLATLTGACVIALGNELAGLWTNNDQLGEQLINAANNAGEGLWKMPLQDSYKEGLKSLLADLKNTGPRQGGSITAALFLKEFINKNIAWAHIDIAGTVWGEKERGMHPIGATGYGVRTLVNWICGQS